MNKIFIIFFLIVFCLLSFNFTLAETKEAPQSFLTAEQVFYKPDLAPQCAKLIIDTERGGLFYAKNKIIGLPIELTEKKKINCPYLQEGGWYYPLAEWEALYTYGLLFWIANLLFFVSTILTVLFFIMGWMHYIFSAGDPERKGKATLCFRISGGMFIVSVVTNIVPRFAGHFL